MKKRRKGRIEKFEEKYKKKEEILQQQEGTLAQTAGHRKKHGGKSRFLLTAVLLIMAIVLFASVKNIFVLQAEKKELTERNEALVQEKESLKDELKNASDEEYIEEQARIQLKMIKPGEILYILENEKNKEDSKENDEEEN